MFVGRVKDLSSENITGPASYMRKPLRFCQIRVAPPKRLFSSFSFTDVANKAGKYSAPVLDQFPEGDLHWEFLPILAEASKFGPLPIDMSLAGTQVTFESLLVQLPHVLRHY